MIQIRFDPQVPLVEAKGHAGTGPKGEDLVCAAVTALVLTLKANAEATGGRGEVGPGFARIRGGQNAQGDFRAVCRGFEILSRAFPQAVRYRVRTGDREIPRDLVCYHYHQEKGAFLWKKQKK